MDVSIGVNGSSVRRDVEPRTLLVHLLRDDLRLADVLVGCDTSNCGACTVAVDGVPVKACAMLAVMVDGRQVTTAEGLTGEVAARVRRVLEDRSVLPCGTCAPAVLVVVTALARQYEHPTADQLRRALSGTLCRCTGYDGLVGALAETLAADAHASLGATR